jgi:hypothetical protein
VRPLDETIAVFLRELIPAWEPTTGTLSDAPSLHVEVAPIARDRAAHAVAEQAAAGARARKTNPKRTALAGLGDREADALAALVLAIQEGTVSPEAVEDELRRLATER